ncbi:MAG: hypothetical protein WAM51_00130, partial [Methylovirgula sp.]
MPFPRDTADTSPPNLPDPRTILNSIGEAVYDWDIVSDRLTFGPNTADIAEFAEFAQLTSGRAYAECLAPESPSSRFETVISSTEHDLGRGVPYKVIYGLTGTANERTSRGKIV